MRPRRIAAENSMAGLEADPLVQRFNEAAANRRGKPPGETSKRSRQTGFNEAAANRRGKLGRLADLPWHTDPLQ